jgi:type II secretory pathway pseudopilin PulG
MSSPDRSEGNAKKRGISFIEILLVIGIMAVLGAATTPFLSRFVLVSNVETTADTLSGTLKKAQNYAINNKANLTWGVCKTGNSLRLFGGTCASPTIFEDYSIPSSVTLNGLNAPGITFSKGRGEPASAISASVVTNLKTITVQVNLGGGFTETSI